MSVKFSTHTVIAAPACLLAGVVFSIALAVLSGCDAGDDVPGGGGAGGSESGGSGGCQPVPQPTFMLTVLAASGGPVPPDTTIEIDWTAGPEPVFHLDDPTTWPALDTANFACDVDAGMPVTNLEALTCALWTAGATDVRVSAQGFVTQESTYTPDPGTACEPEPTPIEIELVEEAP